MTSVLRGIVGHDRPVGFLSGLERTGRIPGGLLFHGPVGVGKHTVARAWLRRLGCEEATGCGRCPSCIRYDSGNVADLEFVGVEEGKTLLSIEQIRKLREWFSLAPYEASRRTAVVDDAHLMTEEAQNSLLKLLEEPPREGLLILVTNEPARLLETVISRVQSLYFPALRDEEVTAVLVQAGWERDRAEGAVALSQGSPGRALALGDEADELVERARELLDRRVGPFTFAEAVCGSARGAQLREVATRVVGTAIDLAARDLSEALVDADDARPERFERVIALLIEAQRSIRGNISPRLLFESTKILVNRALAS